MPRPIRILTGDWDIKHEEWGENQITSEEDLESGESVNEVDEDMKNKALSDHLELRSKRSKRCLKANGRRSLRDMQSLPKTDSSGKIKSQSCSLTDMEHEKETRAS